MFTALAGIIRADEEITVKITGIGNDGRMKVIVMPKLEKGGNLALAQPLALVATPEELDSGFVNTLTEFGASRAGLAEQVAITATIIDAAKKTEAGKATKALQSKTAAAGKAAVVVSDGDGDRDDDADGDGGEGILDASPSPSTASAAPATPAARPAPAPAAVPASANDDLLSLI